MRFRLNSAQGLRSHLRIGDTRISTSIGLNNDDGQRMRHHIMHIACQTGPLCQPGSSTAFLLRAGKHVIVLAHQRHLFDARATVQAGNNGGDDEQRAHQ